MKIKDYYYSQEYFELEEDQGIKKTLNIPENVQEYYHSENYISHQNSRKSIFEKLYAWIQKWNFSYKFKILQKYSQHGKVLDYGCGNGEFLKYLSQKSNYQLYGFDPYCSSPSTYITLYQDINDIEEQFDIIMLWHVFEHVENRETLLQNLRQKLTPQGVLLIAIPNYHSLDAKFYSQEWAAWDVPRHVYHYSKSAAIHYFTQKESFYLDHIYPLPFDSFYISILSATYKKNVFHTLFSPIVASVSNISAQFSGNWSSLIYILKNEK